MIPPEPFGVVLPGPFGCNRGLELVSADPVKGGPIPDKLLEVVKPMVIGVLECLGQSPPEFPSRFAIELGRQQLKLHFEKFFAGDRPLQRCLTQQPMQLRSSG